MIGFGKTSPAKGPHIVAQRARALFARATAGYPTPRSVIPLAVQFPRAFLLYSLYLICHSRIVRFIVMAVHLPRPVRMGVPMIMRMPMRVRMCV